MGLGNCGLDLGEARFELLFEDVEVGLGDVFGISFGEYADDLPGLLGGNADALEP